MKWLPFEEHSNNIECGLYELIPQGMPPHCNKKTINSLKTFCQYLFIWFILSKSTEMLTHRTKVMTSICLIIFAN